MKLHNSPSIYQVPEEPTWNLERRESSGHLVWRRSSPKSKVRFRFDVEVLEYEKNPDEHKIQYDDTTMAHYPIISKQQLSNVFVVCATCVAAVAMTLFLPWYLVGDGVSI